MPGAKFLAFFIPLSLLLPAKTAYGSDDLAITGDSGTVEIRLKDGLLDACIHGRIDMDDVLDIVEGKTMLYG